MKKSLLLGVLILAQTAQAGSTEFVPLQERAQGRSLAGSTLLNDSLFANPAAAALTQVYAIDATALSTKDFAISILDTKTSSLGGGIAYYRMSRAGTDKAIQGAKLGVTSRLGQNFGVGLVGKMLWGPDLDGTNTRNTDLDFGVTSQFDFLQFGLSIHNLLGGHLPMGEVREYSLGGRIGWEQTLFFSAAVSGTVSGLDPQELGFGAEYVSPYQFALKGGFRTRPAESASYWSTGVSILSPKLSLHYALEIPNQGTGGLEHTFGTTVLF